MNEEANIAPLLAAIRASLGELDYEVIFVDDGSTDRTIAEIKTHADSRIHLVELRKNYGQSTAMTRRHRSFHRTIHRPAGWRPAKRPLRYPLHAGIVES